METTQLEHESDVRGFSKPFEPSDGITLKRIVTIVMVIAVAVVIIGAVALGLHFKGLADAQRKSSVVAAQERRMLLEKLDRATSVIENGIAEQKRVDAERDAVLAAAIRQVVREVNAELTRTLKESQAIRSAENSRNFKATVEAYDKTVAELRAAVARLERRLADLDRRVVSQAPPPPCKGVCL